MEPTNVTPGMEKGLVSVRRPTYADVDLDLSRRPGVVWTRGEPHPFPHTQYPPERQQGEPSAPLHGRPHKAMPPVFGTAEPLHGVSGAIRRFAARYPDHMPRYWLLRLFADRVDSFGYHAKKFAKFAVPVIAVGYLGNRMIRAAR